MIDLLSNCIVYVMLIITSIENIQNWEALVHMRCEYKSYKYTELQIFHLRLSIVHSKREQQDEYTKL
jgi:hypothetical protein